MNCAEVDALVDKFRAKINGSSWDEIKSRQGERTGHDSWRRAQRAVGEHWSSIRRIFDLYIDASTNLDKCDRARAEEAVASVYDNLLLPRPRFRWFESPVVAGCAASMCSYELNGRETTNRKHVQSQSLSFQMMQLATQQDRAQDLASALYNGHLRSDGRFFTDHDVRIARGISESWVSRTPSFMDTVFDAIPRDEPLCAKFMATVDQNRHNEYRIAPMGIDRFANRVTSCRLGPGDAFDLAITHIMSMFGVPLPDTFFPLRETMLHCGWWWPFEEVCFMSERPAELVFVDGRLHRLDAPAVRYSDGFELYFIQDRAVTRNIALGNFTARDIENETNAERRRIMIDRFGLEDYLTATGATAIDRDEYGTLYRRELADDEPLVVVRVRNSTPEPDGTFKHYFLRVPPHVRTAREAVAWTFDLRADEYKPRKET